MKWIKLKITTSQESADAISNYLFELGASAVNLEDNVPHSSVLTTYFVSDDLIGARVNKIRSFMAKLRSAGLHTGSESIELESLENKDWIQDSRAGFTPQRIGEHFVVASTWAIDVDLKPDDRLIKIDPGMAFGTGHHSTTSLSIELLEKCIKGGEVVADIGTGSGILSIAAVMLGAKRAKAVDVDETAVAVARENAKLNSVAEKIDVSVGNGLTDLQKQFDLIVVNILTSIILPMIPQFSDRLKSQGKLILSGIMTSEAHLIESALKMHSFELIEKLVSEEWVAMLALNDC